MKLFLINGALSANKTVAGEAILWYNINMAYTTRSDAAMTSYANSCNIAFAGPQHTDKFKERDLPTMIKILHTGDIHLDAPFSNLSAAQAEIRRQELRAAFTSMMTYARTNNVDLILIAGDFFDNDFVTRDTVALIRREFERVSAKIVISPGNHDCFSERSVWKWDGIFPSNVYIFNESSKTKISFDDIGVDVYGYAFTSPELYEWPLAGEHVDDPSNINLVCAHGHIFSSQTPYCRITPQMIEEFGADYTALAHVHNPAADIAKTANGYYAYCGCLEGRSFDELGYKGAIVCDIEKSGGELTFNARRLRFSKKRYEYCEVSVEGAKTLTEVETAISDVISKNKYGEDTILRIKLFGAVDPSLVISKTTLAAAFTQLDYIDLQDRTSPTFDCEALESDRTVRGEFYRTLLPKLNSDDPTEREIAGQALRIGLSALSGENISIL